ncbi:MAG: GGDEF domain-containing protein [Bacillota bacterium]|nr:GGDEF domain-containing protein [Bacillota bacterium]
MKKALFDFLGDYGHNTDLRKDYEQDQLIQNHRFVSLIAVSSGFLQLFLMVPDLLLLSSSEAKVTILILRTIACFSTFVFAWFWHRKSIKSYAVYSRSVSGLEAIAILLFLYVFSQYDPPDFLIQAMGMMVIIMVIFIIPNRFRYRLFLAFGGLTAFLLLARLVLQGSLSPNAYMAGLFYMLIALVLCAIFSRTLDKHQFREYKAKNQLIHLNTIDALTSAFNRNKLIDAWGHWFSWCQRYGQPLAIAMFDVDGFKKINDVHGHSVADVVLIELVDLINSQLRASDVLARWGGDEFVILLPNTSVGDSVKVLNRIRRLLSHKLLAGCIAVRCSFGVASVQSASTLDSIIREADSLMYLGKKAGGDQIHTSPVNQAD